MPPPHPENTRWFAEEVTPHEPSLRAYLRGSFPSVHDVDDVVQESYLRVWRARLSAPVRSTKAFLFLVARHLAVDLVRRDRISPFDRRHDANILLVCDEGRDVAEAVCTRDEVALLARALHVLPARCREVMILRQIEGLSQKEIASRLGLSVLTVQVHVVKGLRRLEAFFRDHGAGGPRR